MKHLSLLRGINVGGQKKIKMVELKALYEGLGFADVQTYIQSGNVVFDADSGLNHQTLIEQAIQKAYGFDVHVLVRTKDEFNAMVEACPFGEVDLEVEGGKVLATLLSDEPNSEAMDSLASLKHESESLVVLNKVVYLRCPNGYGKTKLSNNLLEKKLKVQATTRNWRSMKKLQEMLHE